VAILIDPGMGRRHLIRCLARGRARGVRGHPDRAGRSQPARAAFPQGAMERDRGARWFWGGVTLGQLRGGPWSGSELAPTTADQPAAIIFPPAAPGSQRRALHPWQLRRPGRANPRTSTASVRAKSICRGFPLFGLFNCVMGVNGRHSRQGPFPARRRSIPPRSSRRQRIGTLPKRSARRPFGIAWAVCEAHAVRLPMIRRVLSAGAAGCRPEVLRRMKACIHRKVTFTHRTERPRPLPVASISASEVLGSLSAQGTAAETRLAPECASAGRFPMPSGKSSDLDGPIPNARRGRRVAARGDGELDRPRSAGYAAVRHAHRVEPAAGQDRRRAPRCGIWMGDSAIWTRWDVFGLRPGGPSRRDRR